MSKNHCLKYASEKNPLLRIRSTDSQTTMRKWENQFSLTNYPIQRAQGFSNCHLSAYQTCIVKVTIDGQEPVILLWNTGSMYNTTKHALDWYIYMCQMTPTLINLWMLSETDLKYHTSNISSSSIDFALNTRAWLNPCDLSAVIFLFTRLMFFPQQEWNPHFSLS